MVTRIRQLLDTKQLTPTQFADFIGVGRPVMSHILSERNKPSLEVVQRIISAFPDVSLPWLLSGVGEMMSEATAGVPAILPTIEPQEAAAPVLSPVAPIVEETLIASEVAKPEASQPQLPSESMPEGPITAASVAPVAPAAPTPAVPIASHTITAPVAPRAFATGPQPFLIPEVSAPVVASAPSALVSPSAAAVIQPFRAARFVPAVGVPAATPRKATVADLPTSEASALAPTLGLTSGLPPLAASPSTAPAASKPAPAAMPPFLGEPGKEIRRIVIFYRDGSFSDYQPEA